MINTTSYSVFRNAEYGDCSNNGLSSRVNSGIMFSNCSREQAIEYCETHNIDPSKQFFLHERTLFGEDHSFAEPLILKHGCQMFGGNFLYTSNGNGFRFSGEKTMRPIPIHDRFESAEEYAALSA